MPERQFIFGQPDIKKTITLRYKETNTYVTLKLAKEGRDKGVTVVWLQPQ